MDKKLNYKDTARTEKVKTMLFKTAVYAFLVLCALAVLFPFYWMLLTSVKGYGAYTSEYIPKLFTLTPTFENYVKAFTAVPLAKYFLNTLIYTLATTALMLAVVIPAAFLGGAVFCMGCDLIARIAFAPTELNISTVTSVFGAPVVIMMMLKRQKGR